MYFITLVNKNNTNTTTVSKIIQKVIMRKLKAVNYNKSTKSTNPIRQAGEMLHVGVK